MPKSNTDHPGRPKFEVTEEILRFLLDKRFTVKDTATLLGVSKRTLERRMNEFASRIGNYYFDINDNDLEETVRSIVQQFPNTGYKRMTGLLFSRGLRVQQNRIREMMRRVDPSETFFRILSLRVVH